MVYYRKGQEQWIEWEGEGYEPDSPDNLIYFTLGYVDKNSQLIDEHVAGALRRDGVADGWGDAFKMAENVTILNGYVAEVEDGEYLFWNDIEDEPVDGLLYEPATFVEISLG